MVDGLEGEISRFLLAHILADAGEKALHLPLAEIIGIGHIEAQLRGVEALVSGESDTAHVAADGNNLRIGPRQHGLAVLLLEAHGLDFLKRVGVFFRMRIAFDDGCQRHQGIVAVEAGGDELFEMRESADAEGGVRDITRKHALDLRQGHPLLLVEAADEANAVHMGLIVISHVGFGPLGLGQQAMAEIDADGLAVDAGGCFQVTHLHGRGIAHFCGPL